MEMFIIPGRQIILTQNITLGSFIWSNIWVVSPLQFPSEDFFVLSLAVFRYRNAKRYSGRTLRTFGSLHLDHFWSWKVFGKWFRGSAKWLSNKPLGFRFMWTANECSVTCMWIVWLPSSPAIMSKHYISTLRYNCTDFRCLSLGWKVLFQSSYRH